MLVHISLNFTHIVHIYFRYAVCAGMYMASVTGGLGIMTLECMDDKIATGNRVDANSVARVWSKLHLPF